MNYLIVDDRPGARQAVIEVPRQPGDESMANEARATGALQFISKNWIAELPEVLDEIGHEAASPNESM